MYYSSEYLSFCKGIVHQSVSFNFLPIMIDYIIRSYLCSPYEPKERHGFVSHNTIFDIIQSEMMSSAEVFDFLTPHYDMHEKVTGVSNTYIKDCVTVFGQSHMVLFHMTL